IRCRRLYRSSRTPTNGPINEYGSSVAAMLDGVRRGRTDAARGDVPDPTLDGPEVVAVERAWESLSELLDATAGEDREQTLLRLALLLASKVDGPGLAAAIEAARPAR
ncbi:hypothetical protein, partial [Cumulibacter manganitolerans]|uniref:hypothetical protein n=1 Tax=Cumulibacter manganitolerans TaxID=1884992 RepID=UPI0018863F61